MAKKTGKKHGVKKTVDRTMPWQTLVGLTFCIEASWADWILKSYQQALRTAGARIVDKVTKDLDYLVVPNWLSKSTPAATLVADLNANQGAHIRIIDEKAAFALAVPPREQAVTLLTSGDEGIKTWNRITQFLGRDVVACDLSGVEMPGCRLKSARLLVVNVDRVNFEGATLEECEMTGGHGLRLDGATFLNCEIKRLSQISARRLQANRLRVDSAEECTFDEAVLDDTWIKQIVRSSFQRARCPGINLAAWRSGKNCDFTDADLTGACSISGNLSGSVFRRAILTGADFRRCNMRGADLRDADLCRALLTEADLTDAKVDGANFEGATLIDVKLDGVDPAKAKGLDPAKTRLGPALVELDNIAGKADGMSIKTEVARQEDFVAIELIKKDQFYEYHWTTPDGPDWSGWPATSYSRALVEVAHLWQDGELRLDSIKVSGKNSPVKGRQLKDTVVAACREAFGVGAADEKTTQSQTKAAPPAGPTRDDLLQELKGKDGVKRFNARSPAEIVKAGSFRSADLSGARLNGVKFPRMDLQAAVFDGATLARAKFDQCRCRHSSFKKANLREANLSHSGFNEADFTEASLAKARLSGCSLRKAVFRGASLASADLGSADLAGADLSSADLEGTRLSGTSFDETTRFPKGFKLPKDMDWRGKGVNPALRVRRKKVGSLSMEEFMAHLGKSVDAQRLKNALKMLKADRFQLFVEINDDSLVGVVKSQRDKELVYSCQLTGEGNFACCTQNLNICGGLRGALCKHLLVLIVGLVKSGRIDAAEIDNWIAASKARRPQLDKDVMSETLLRYKGAEAGEIDWRPTETVPEDFYAF